MKHSHFSTSFFSLILSMGLFYGTQAFGAVCDASTVYLCVATELVSRRDQAQDNESLIEELKHYPNSKQRNTLISKLGGQSNAQRKSSNKTFFEQHSKLKPSEIDELAKNQQLDLVKKSDDILQISSFLHVYRSALLQVLPITSQQLKLGFKETISAFSIEEQTTALTDISLIELFSGDINASMESIKHASLLTPNDSRVVLTSHIIQQLHLPITNITKQTGFQAQNCTSGSSTTFNGTATLLKNEYQTLDSIIVSIPDINLRLRSYILFASYLQHLNPCHPQFEYFKYRALQTLQSIDSVQTQWQLGVQLMKSLRRYFTS